MASDRHIPESIARKVRQECRFGCVLCGMPIFQYDHIDEFSEAREHKVENIALLCPNHHQEKTSRRLSKERVKNARNSPYNANRASTAKYGLIPNEKLKIALGSNEVTYDGSSQDHVVLWINGTNFASIHFEGDYFTFSAVVTDASGQELLTIDRGMLAASTHVWDYQYQGRVLSIRGGPGEIIFQAEIADQLFKILRGTFVDRHETGIIVDQAGNLSFSMSGLEVGVLSGAKFDSNATGAIAVRRESCFGEQPLPGFGFVRSWSAEYEQMATQLRSKMEAGLQGRYPKGLKNFKPMP